MLQIDEGLADPIDFVELLVTLIKFAKLVELVGKEKPRLDDSLRNRPEPVPTLLKLAESLLEKEPSRRPAKIDDVLQQLDAASKNLPRIAVAPLHGYMAAALTGVRDDAREAIDFLGDVRPKPLFLLVSGQSADRNRHRSGNLRQAEACEG